MFFVTTCSGVCAFWRRQRRMLLQAAERSATMRLQLNHCSHRVQLSPTMSHRQQGQRALDRRHLGRRQCDQRQSSAAVDPRFSYFATVVPVEYVDESGLSYSQFPDPPLYSEVSCSQFLSVMLQNFSGFSNNNRYRQDSGSINDVMQHNVLSFLQCCVECRCSDNYLYPHLPDL